MGKVLPGGILAAFVGFVAQPCTAATIEIIHGGVGAPATIFVTGTLQFGDDEHFVNRIVRIDDGIVIFDSPGGNLDAGLEIGRAIRLKGLPTLVPDGNECASACAFAWLAGRPRYMATERSIGFHAASVEDEIGPRERGAPNALLGAYLNQFDLTSQAIFCITSTPPDSITWLSFAAAAECGIDVERWMAEVAKSSKEQDRLIDGQEPSSAAETQDLSDIATPVVPQRAIYYFQGAEGSSGRAVEGSVTWVETTRDNAPAVQATLRLAEPEVTAIVTIYRNNDTSLPASHMVEVEFQGTLGTTAIQRVPALVLKSTEQARGEPLAGAAVPVSADLFWIALSDEAEEETRNITLLREGAWFDIPILFTDGTRALLTFEKGVPGDRVFQTVMSAWTPA